MYPISLLLFFIKDQYLTIKSKYFTDKPVERGFSFSNDSNVVLRKKIVEKSDDLFFYELRNNGVYEVINVITTVKGKTFYLIIHINTNTTFVIEKNAFDLLFKTKTINFKLDYKVL